MSPVAVKDVDGLRHFRFERILNDGMRTSRLVHLLLTARSLQTLWHIV